ncbi:RNA polymerase sigma factor [Cyclobacterium jeungdonense]|uniref:Sigma-70 family RNA polymerase sigma factor n=1 Tax=Cyclobacterium jeungdonense TaxID=708087 RepID=A0ABT8C2D1_9BACT|nr:sigma-70 family RNA polymerase sigma factor [Cyclobacterium jeungdonense]MDN3686227.1 sigma-70 family RNA polymerase sigma factor [Cyclobacterium jeungdonense]
MPRSHFNVSKQFPAERNKTRSADKIPDATLWDQFRKGSDAAFIEIYEQYFDRLFAYGMRLTGDESLTKDGIQEVFFDLRNLRTKLGSTDHIRFYLLKCLKRKLFRQHSGWEKRRADLSEKDGFGFELSHEQILIDRQLDGERIEQLNRAIAVLSPRKKEIIYYFFYEGLSYAEIRELMGMDSDHSTRNLMYKALAFLRKTLR